MKIILTKEEVELLNYKQCQAALKALAKTYDLEKPLSKMTKAEYDLVDDIGNTLLYLEDRIKQFEDPRIPSMDPGQTIIKPPEPKIKKSGPVCRKFRIGEVIYDDIHTAARKTGVKVNTLRNYVGRKPDIYEYLN